MVLSGAGVASSRKRDPSPSPLLHILLHSHPVQLLQLPEKLLLEPAGKSGVGGSAGRTTRATHTVKVEAGSTEVATAEESAAAETVGMAVPALTLVAVDHS